MIPVDMVTEIQAYGFDALAARIYPLLTRANRKVCAMGPFPFTEKFSTWTEPVATAGVPLPGAPADIRAVRNLGLPGILENDGNVSYLRKDLVEKYYGFNSYLLADFPRHYSVYGRNATDGMNLYVWPYFTSSTLFALDYHANPPVLGAGTTALQMLLPDAYTDIIQNMVLAELCRSDGDLEDAAMYTDWARVGCKDLLNDFDVNEDSPNPMLFTDDYYYD